MIPLVIIPREILSKLANPVGQRIYVHSNPVVRWLFWTRLRHLAAMLPRATRVLDFGCGEGAMLPTLSRAADAVTGVDLDVKSASDIAAVYNLTNVRLFEGDALTIPLEDAGFDLIVATDSLEHFTDLGAALRRIHGLLRPGGYLAVSGPTENLFYRLGRLLFGFAKPEDHYHPVGRILSEIGRYFRIERVRHAPFGLPWFSPFVLILARKQ